MSSQIIPLKSRRFAAIQSNFGHGDHSRLSCGVGDTQPGAEFCGDLQQAFCTDPLGRDAIMIGLEYLPNARELVTFA
jgi:hypothetical protein